MIKKNSNKNRLIIVSNRLPFTVVEKEDKLRFQDSAGGLVSGLKAYLETLKSYSFAKSEYIWVGSPGNTVKDNLKEQIRSKALSEFKSYPIFPTKKTMEKFYHGFCNKLIWPLFHYFPSYAVYNEDFWINYKSVNETFCNAILDIIKPGDIVWIHDYHLMLLPKLLREKMPDATIGFFLHTPFPSYEIFRSLPRKWSKEILNGLLGADLIGFHTQDYTQYFLRCVLRILGHEHNMGQIIVQNRIVKADTFPMGIDFKKFNNAASIPEIQNQVNKLKGTFANFKTILSVDRLDYTKGITKRLRGYEIFLENNPQWRRKVVLNMVVIPSRTKVEQYKHMKTKIDEIVGRINGKFGSVNWTPVLYQYKSLPFNSLAAQYIASDIALVTPLRDGMNLIAKEYIAAKADKTGILILSEMAGASMELGEAIIINPNNAEEVSDALIEALDMPQEDQIRRNRVMQKRLGHYDVIHWVDDFVHGLLSIKEEQKKFNTKMMDSDMKKHLVKDFDEAKRKLIFLDYDGTLVPFKEDPQMAKPTEELLKIIRKLSEDQKTDIVLISGRDKNTIQNWFGMLNIILIAEHGVWIKKKNQDWIMLKPLKNDWKSQIRPILDSYTDRLPGSFVEEKEFSIVWHYRRADPELGSFRAKELMDDLVNFTANTDVQVIQGSKVVEIRNADADKGTAGLHFISKKIFDFILAIGDDWTDEDLFKVLPETAYSIRVGITQSYARFNLYDYTGVIQLLEQLIKSDKV
jgi:trehalose 6-phosphate synthase/phosphatase